MQHHRQRPKSAFSTYAGDQNSAVFEMTTQHRHTVRDKEEARHRLSLFGLNSGARTSDFESSLSSSSSFSTSFANPTGIPLWKLLLSDAVARARVQDYISTHTISPFTFGVLPRPQDGAFDSSSLWHVSLSSMVGKTREERCLMVRKAFLAVVRKHYNLPKFVRSSEIIDRNAQREHLITAVRNTACIFWSLFPKFDGMIDRKSFCAFNTLVELSMIGCQFPSKSKLLSSEPLVVFDRDLTLFEDITSLDWSQSNKGFGRTMNYETFENYMYELTELWVEPPLRQNSVQFLELLSTFVLDEYHGLRRPTIHCLPIVSLNTLSKKGVVPESVIRSMMSKNELQFAEELLPVPQSKAALNSTLRTNVMLTTLSSSVRRTNVDDIATSPTAQYHYKTEEDHHQEKNSNLTTSIKNRKLLHRSNQNQKINGDNNVFSQAIHPFDNEDSHQRSNCPTVVDDVSSSPLVAIQHLSLAASFPSSGVSVEFNQGNNNSLLLCKHLPQTMSNKLQVGETTHKVCVADEDDVCQVEDVGNQVETVPPSRSLFSSSLPPSRLRPFRKPQGEQGLILEKVVMNRFVSKQREALVDCAAIDTPVSENKESLSIVIPTSAIVSTTDSIAIPPTTTNSKFAPPAFVEYVCGGIIPSFDLQRIGDSNPNMFSSFLQALGNTFPDSSLDCISSFNHHLNADGSNDTMQKHCSYSKEQTSFSVGSEIPRTTSINASSPHNEFFADASHQRRPFRTIRPASASATTSRIRPVSANAKRIRPASASATALRATHASSVSANTGRIRPLTASAILSRTHGFVPATRNRPGLASSCIAPSSPELISANTSIVTAQVFVRPKTAPANRSILQTSYRRDLECSVNDSVVTESNPVVKSSVSLGNEMNVFSSKKTSITRPRTAPSGRTPSTVEEQEYFSVPLSTGIVDETIELQADHRIDERNLSSFLMEAEDEDAVQFNNVSHI